MYSDAWQPNFCNHKAQTNLFRRQYFILFSYFIWFDLILFYFILFSLFHPLYNFIFPFSFSPFYSFLYSCSSYSTGFGCRKTKKGKKEKFGKYPNVEVKIKNHLRTPKPPPPSTQTVLPISYSTTTLKFLPSFFVTYNNRNCKRRSHFISFSFLILSRSLQFTFFSITIFFSLICEKKRIFEFWFVYKRLV